MSGSILYSMCGCDIDNCSHYVVGKGWYCSGACLTEKILKLEQENDSLKRRCEEQEDLLEFGFKLTDGICYKEFMDDIKYTYGEFPKLKALAEKMAKRLESIGEEYPYYSSKELLAAYRKAMEGKE